MPFLEPLDSRRHTVSLSVRRRPSACSVRPDIKAQYTPPTPTRLDLTVASRQRRRCVSGITQEWNADVRLGYSVFSCQNLACHCGIKGYRLKPTVDTKHNHKTRKCPRNAASTWTSCQRTNERTDEPTNQRTNTSDHNTSSQLAHDDCRRMRSTI